MMQVIHLNQFTTELHSNETTLNGLSKKLVKMMRKFGLHFEKLICWSKKCEFLTF